MRLFLVWFRQGVIADLEILEKWLEKWLVTRPEDQKRTARIAERAWRRCRRSRGSRGSGCVKSSWMSLSEVRRRSGWRSAGDGGRPVCSFGRREARGFVPRFGFRECPVWIWFSNIFRQCPLLYALRDSPFEHTQLPQGFAVLTPHNLLWLAQDLRFCRSKAPAWHFHVMWTHLSVGCSALCYQSSIARLEMCGGRAVVEMAQVWYDRYDPHKKMVVVSRDHRLKCETLPRAVI